MKKKISEIKSEVGEDRTEKTPEAVINGSNFPKFNKNHKQEKHITF